MTLIASVYMSNWLELARASVDRTWAVNEPVSSPSPPSPPPRAPDSLVGTRPSLWLEAHVRQQQLIRTAKTDTTVTRTGWNTAPGGDGWLALARTMSDELQTTQERDDEKLHFTSRLEFSLDPMRGLRRNSGDERVEHIQRDLDSFGVTRTPTQRLFHYWFLQAIFEVIYGPEWDSSATRVLRRFGLQRVRNEVMVLTPRRFGKTWSVALFVVSVLLNVPGIKIAIFSTGRRASGSLMKIALGFLDKIPSAYRRICKFSNEELFIAEKPLPMHKSMNSNEARRAQSDPKTSTLHSFPSNVIGKSHYTPLFPFIHTYPHEHHGLHAL